MLTAIVGLVGAVVYGAADFMGGLAAKRMSAVRVTAIGAATGLLALLVATPVVGGVWSVDALGWGALSGVAAAAAIAMLYACLAIGPMSILSPLTAVVSAIVPLSWGLVGGERLGVLGYIALGLAVVAIVLVGFVPEQGAVRPSLRGVLLAIGAGSMLGLFLILIDRAPEESGLVPLIASRSVNAVVMTIAAIVIVVAQRTRSEPIGQAGPRGPWRGGVGIAAVAGVADALANTLLLVGLRIGDLTVMSVLIAMYPAGTVILAAAVLRERIAPVQWVGLALALTAAAMLAV